LDEIFHIIGRKDKSELHANLFVSTIMSREPRQIVGYIVDFDRLADKIQVLVDTLPIADNYFSDGFVGYCKVDFCGRHHRTFGYDKSNTHNIESTNADFRTYIAGLQRRSRCFFKSLETAEAMVELFVNAYNHYGEAKQRYRESPYSIVRHKTQYPKHLHKYRDTPFNIFDFVLAT
jgi:IS1 family transposase